MPVASAVLETLNSQSLIRKMFEEGLLLKKQHGADKVFDFSLGNPDLDPPPEFKKVLQKFASNDEKGVHGYMPNAGFSFVRETLARKASIEQNVELDESGIIMSCGAAGGLNVVFKSILNPGDEVIVTRPYFMEYRPYAANHGGRIVEAEACPDFSLNVEAIREKLTPRTAAVLINSPNNPTGRIYPAETIAHLASILKEHGKKCGRLPYLISDEPYRELAYDGAKIPPVLSAYDESIVVSSYSKSLSLPGERIGYIALAPGINDKQNLFSAMVYATRVLGFVNAPALMQRVAAELVSSKIDIDIYARRRSAFTSILDEIGIQYAKPEGAFYLFCKVPDQFTDDKEFAERLKKELILGVPGSGFGKPGWIRFAYCVDEKIIKASRPAFQKAVSLT